MKERLKQSIVISVLLIIPFIYVLFFLKAFWNPYDSISNVPVAVVNLDDGEVGREIVKKLIESNKMKVIELKDDFQAENGVKEREYYSSITIPENFSKNIQDLKESTIIFRSNKKFNFIASQIYERAAVEVQGTIKNTISNTIATRLHGSIEESAGKISTLSSGLNQLNDGSKQLSTGIKSLNDNYIKFDKEGIEVLKSGVKEYTNGVNQAADGLDQISRGVITLGDKLGVLKWSADFKKLYEGAKKVQDENVKDKLIAGGDKLNSGAEKLSENSKKILDGTNKLYQGSIKLNNGLSVADTKVSKSVSDSKSKLNSIKNLDEFVSDSVNLKIINIDDVEVYGTVFAAYFISISLWVGGLVIMVTLYYDSKQRFGIFDKGYDNKIKQYLAYISLILIQSILLTLLITKTFNFNGLNLPIFFVSLLIVDLAFFNMIFFFISSFDDIGKFIAMILLIVQISSSAGTFPIETAPGTLMKLFPFVPMRYSINIFKEALAGVDYKFFYPNLNILLLILFVFILLNFIVVYIKDMKIKKKDEIEKAQN